MAFSPPETDLRLELFREPPIIPSAAANESLGFDAVGALKVVVGSDSDRVVRTTLQSISKTASAFSKVMPESYTGEHLVRAEMMCKPGNTNATLEALKLKVFLMSNNFDCDDGDVVICFENSGLMDTHSIRRLLSSNETTLEAFTEKLWASAIRWSTASFCDNDVVHTMLKAGFDPNRPVLCPPEEYNWLEYSEGCPSYLLEYVRKYSKRHLTSLQLALLCHNIELATLLVRGGADVNGTINEEDLTPLELAASLADHKEATTVAQLLLSKGAAINRTSYDGPSALTLAIRQEHWELARIL